MSRDNPIPPGHPSGWVQIDRSGRVLTICSLTTGVARIRVTVFAEQQGALVQLCRDVAAVRTDLNHTGSLEPRVRAVLPPEAPDRVICDLTYLSDDDKVTGFARICHDAADQTVRDLFQVSALELCQTGGCLTVSALLNGVDHIGEVRVHHAEAVCSAMLHLPDAADSGIPARIEARLDLFDEQTTSLRIVLCDLAGQPLMVQTLDPQGRRQDLRRPPRPNDVIVAAQDRDLNLTAVTVAIGDLVPPVRMHLYVAGQLVATEDAYVSSARSAPVELVSRNKADWVATTVFDQTPEMFDIVVQDAEGGVAFCDIKAIRLRHGLQIDDVWGQYCDQTGHLVVEGICGFQGITHAQVMCDDRVILSGRSYLRSYRESFLTTPGCGIYLAGLWQGDLDVQLDLALYCGERCLIRGPLPLRRRRSNHSPAPGPSCHATNGAAHYRFCPPDPSDTRPWVICATGMEAWPVTGGGMARTYSLARYVRNQGYRVALVVEYPANQSEECVIHLRDIADAVVFVPRTDPISAIDADHASVHRTNPSLGPVLSTMERIYAPRAVIVNFAFNLYAAETLDSHVILDAHDVQHLRAENALKQGADLEDRRCTRADEAARLSRADTVLAIQKDEAAILRDLAPDKTVLTTAHTLHVDPLSDPPGAEMLKELLFVGQSYRPNIDGLRAFLDRAWPDIRRRHPEAHLHVVGRVCEAFSPQNWPGVTFHHVVPDLDVFYRRCGICINPTDYGTGFKIKTLEGLAHRRVVVSTENGAIGLPEDVPLRVAALDQFADVICALIETPQAAVDLAQAGADYIASQFSPDQVYRSLALHLAALPEPTKAQTPDLQLVRHRLEGHGVFLELALAPQATTHPKSVTLTAHFGIGRPVELLVAWPSNRATAEIQLPLPVWYRDGKPFEVALAANGRDLGRITLRAPNAHRSDYLMPNWAVAGVFPDAPHSILVPQEPDMPIAPEQSLFTIYCKGRKKGIAIGPARSAFNKREQWVAHLSFAPADLPLRTQDPLSVYSRYPTYFVAEIAVADLWPLRRACVGQRVGQARPPQGIWKPRWPLDGQRRTGIPVSNVPDWHCDDSCVSERRLTALVRVRRRAPGLVLTFPPDATQDTVFQWGLLVDTLPVTAQRKLSLTAQGVALLFTLRRPLEPGVRRLDLIGPPAAGPVPVALRLQETLP